MRIVGRSRSGLSPFAAPAILLVLGSQPARAQDLWPGQAERVRRIQETVMAGNAALAAVRAELEAGRARTAGAGFAPPMVLSGEIEEVPDGYDVTGAHFRLELGRELLTGGRGNAARALAAAGAELSGVRLAALERRLRADVLRHLARLDAADAVARRLASEDVLLQDAEASARDLFSLGEARYMDVLRLRTERLRVQSDRVSTLAERHAALESLVSLADPARRAEVVSLADSFVAAAEADRRARLPEPPALDSLVALAAPVLLAQAWLERTHAARSLALAEQRPRFAASLGAERRVTPGGDNAFGPVIGASLTLPFTARGANRAERLAFEAEVASAEAMLSNLRALARGALAGAVERYEAVRERVALYDAALIATARDEREGALAAYRSGDISLLELLDFERALSRAEIESSRAYAAAVEAYANLIAGVGPDVSGEMEAGSMWGQP